MEEKVNYLCDQNYLISDELQYALLNGKLPCVAKENRYIDKTQKGLYLILLEMDDMDKKKIVYKYVQYNLLFYSSFSYYI